MSKAVVSGRRESGFISYDGSTGNDSSISEVAAGAGSCAGPRPPGWPRTLLRMASSSGRIESS